MVIFSAIMVVVCVVFGKFWVETTGMDATSVAKQLQQVGFSVPGFRRDERVIERVLERYIPIITVLGSAAVGLLASGADVTGALGTGTGILLSVGILYRLYEELAASQLMEMHPALKGFFE
jgi:preprotein translocase subunit SecY